MIKLDLNPSRKFLRQFAWAGLFMFPLLGGLFMWKFHLPFAGFVVLAAIGVLVFAIEVLLLPLVGEATGKLLENLLPKPVYRLMTLIAFPIGLVVSNVVIGAIYYLMMTPLALVFRLIGRDPMGRRPDKGAASYWHDRGAAPDPSSYLKLY